MRFHGFACALLAVSAFGSSARGLVLDSGDGLGNTSPPRDDPGWAHVGSMSGLSVVYLGNGWVITARHAVLGPVQLRGRRHEVVRESLHRLQNPDGDAAKPDVMLFRVEPPPDLPALELVSATPEVGAFVMMMGRGRSRGSAIQLPGVAGYRWGPDAVPRWGTNRVFRVGVDVEHARTRTRAIATRFDYAGTLHEAQAARGDSGGAVFVRTGGRWQLAGILVLTSKLDQQPAETALYGNLSYAVDLGYYRDQLVAILRSGRGS